MFSQTVDTDIQLALVQPSFAPRYVELINTHFDYLSQWLAWPPHCNTESDFLNFIRRSLQEYAEGKSMVCAIFYQGTLVGNCSFNTINHSLKTVDIGYWLAADKQGKGIITRVCRHLISIAFEQLEMEKVVIAAAVENQASRAVAERLGMTREGVISRSENLNGRILDHAIYALHRQHHHTEFTSKLAEERT
ncbi:GNAT family N-acetyltransferase [Photobacterium galatheae]|uniref:50S ribosomal protein L7/L12 n=1 Tax=Photobacterium galatheae TaxID=1654360 RepID=A0A066RSM1_9GAMM|nr:GNAT family protein [Photobacterium galatheae]KDM90398.1 50S ribosomal protein L7/L12 [Photobacterium galatheae]MCM0147882.1 GNAT family N-acetyltransferase [Photobacterium galatheae]